jgi:uncharacterized protein
MHDISSLDCSRIAQDLQIRKVQVEAVVGLLDEGNTVPFITRYRKERSGGLGEDVIRQIQTRIQFLRQLAERKQTILKSIEGQGKLTEDLKQAILKADTVKRLEDLYLPYKPKKRSLATKAREQGLEPLAWAIWYSDPAAANLDEMLPALINPEKELNTPDEVRAGVQNLLAEMMAETALIRAGVRSVLWETGKVCASKSDKLPEGQGLEYKDYFEFSEAARQIPPHRILALNRGEKEHAVKVRLEWNVEAVKDTALKALSERLLYDAGRMPALKPPATPSSPAPPSPAPPSPPSAGAAPASPESGAPAGWASAGEAPDAEQAAATPAGAAPVTLPSTPQAPVPEPPPSPPAEPAPLPPPVEAPPLTASLNMEPLPITLHGESLAGGEFKSPHASFLRTVLDDALMRLLLPSLEREIRRELTDEAESHAVAVFARNLRSLLLQPPLRGKQILAIDPGFRTGCKVAALDEYGNLLEHSVIYPHVTHPKKAKDKPKEAAAAAAVPAAAAPAPAAPATEAPAPASTLAAPVESVAQTTRAPHEPAAPDTFAAPVTAASPPEQPAAPAAAEPPAPAPEPAPTPAPEAPAPVAQEPAAAPAPIPAGEAPAAPASEASAPASVPQPPPVDKRADAKAKLSDLVNKHHLQVVALGNGTGCRETEELIADLIATSCPDLAYVVVNEAGASVYSVSPVGREEFPDFDATLRGTISIGRRLQDPLSELVKVDPQSIGVGLYQHDMGRKELKESLEAVVESCVNLVGADLNTASVPLLRHVSGLNQMVARELIDYRKQHGPFSTREALLQVPGLGPARYVQAAGFLKIPGGPNPLDRTWIHPESYPAATQILSDLGYTPNVLDDKGAQEEFQAKLKTVQSGEVAKRLNVGLPTVEDILQALARPGRDPREDLPPPIFKKGILKLEDLQAGMELKGTVLNVVDFGAFVDIGLKDSGLVHISQMANRYIKSPYDVVAVSDVVTVWVLTVDKERHRVSLTMIQPGTERKPPERGQPRPPREARPTRGRRPEPAHGEAPAQTAAQGQGHGQGRPPRGRDPGRRGPGGPPPRAPAPPVGAQPAAPGETRESAGSGPAAGAAAQATAPPPRPAPPPRKPRREPPRPKLSQAALEGKVPLRTFGELSALFAAKKEPDKKEPERKPAEASAPAAAPQAEAAPGEQTPAEPAPATQETPPPGPPAAPG